MCLVALQSKRSLLNLEVSAIVILLIGVIGEPVSPPPKGRGHFIQEFALGPVTEDMLPQPLLSGWLLLPQLLLVPSLFSYPKTTVQPQKPLDHRLHRLPLSLPQADVSESPGWLNSAWKQRSNIIENTVCPGQVIMEG